MISADTHRAMKRLGYKVSEERVKQDLSREDVAKGTGRGVQTIVRIEGGYNCTIASILDVAQFLGCDLELRRINGR